jgi:hypothetical protein
MLRARFHALPWQLACLLLLVPVLWGNGAAVVLCTADDGHTTLEAAHPGRPCEVEQRRHAEPRGAAFDSLEIRSAPCSDAALVPALGPQELRSERLSPPPGPLVTTLLAIAAGPTQQAPSRSEIARERRRVAAELRSIVLRL